ncbi:hypothetical protein VCUG_02049 [Vavraia culicis subsp. floridensis]|uniref:Ribosomal protein L35Ae n=1 Tax=Vavraia culicis (isolate floridensis) TaxID=948595 RepID=L2GS56_VAVCU|nr:uncharacterized protein VCUG_02049 [Vavraia culicis subsp. floridensis]ELA46454.1 hypothetical protein VCUG_02049 [Vavraia culicis subsp. floridensis]
MQAQYAFVKQHLLKDTLSALGKFVSHRRAQRRLHPSECLVRVDHVHSKDEAQKYVGNEVELFKMYVKDSNNVVKSVKGRVVKVHGRRGVVICRFDRNLSPTEINTRVYVKLCKAEEYE